MQHACACCCIPARFVQRRRSALSVSAAARVVLSARLRPPLPASEDVHRAKRRRRTHTRTLPTLPKFRSSFLAFQFRIVFWTDRSPLPTQPAAAAASHRSRCLPRLPTAPSIVFRRRRESGRPLLLWRAWNSIPVKNQESPPFIHIQSTSWSGKAYLNRTTRGSLARDGRRPTSPAR